MIDFAVPVDLRVKKKKVKGETSTLTLQEN